MASPVSCRNLNRRCLKSHIVKMVSVKSIMNMSRLALSCLWLSSANLSVATLSIALLSPWLPTSRNVNRKGSDRKAFDGLTPRKRLSVNPIVAFCVTFVVWVVSVVLGKYCLDEKSARDENKWQLLPQPLSKHWNFRFFKIKVNSWLVVDLTPTATLHGDWRFDGT